MDHLRALIDDWLTKDQLKRIDGANVDLEIGALSEVVGAGPEAPTLFFDKIQGYPQGFRILTNMFQTQRRTAAALGIADTLRGPALVNAIRATLESYRPIPPVTVTAGPVTENIVDGKEVDLFKFPAPKLHKEDGGRYIGTQDAVITRDLEGNWVNLGSARVQVQEPAVVKIWCA